MKKGLLLIIGLVILFIACDEIENAGSKENGKTDSATVHSDWKPVDSATATKEWMEFATPGALHKILAKYDGNWTGATTTWMEEGGQPVKSTSECANKMILGRRYQLGNYKGYFMGMLFEGMSIMGYDNAKKKFVGAWINNMGTGIMTAEGVWNPSKKSVEFKGKAADPTQTNKECAIREIYTFNDDNTYTFEMYGPGSKTGKEMKTMEIKFVRKK